MTSSDRVKNRVHAADVVSHAVAQPDSSSIETGGPGARLQMWDHMRTAGL